MTVLCHLAICIIFVLQRCVDVPGGTVLWNVDSKEVAIIIIIIAGVLHAVDLDKSLSKLLKVHPVAELICC